MSLAWGPRKGKALETQTEDLTRLWTRGPANLDGYGRLWPVMGRFSADDGKHLRCREFRLYREGWWGVWGEEGGKKIGFHGYGRFGTGFVGFVNRPFRSRGVPFLANLDPIFWPEGCFAS